MTESPRPLVLRRADSGRIQIASNAVETMLRFRQTNPTDAEAGGVLLGRYITDSSDIVVDQVSIPQTGDKRSRFRFYRARKRHQQIIDETWAASNGTVTYLGEWHTHPEPNPTPSLIDCAGWKRKAFFDRSSDAIFFIIVGTARLAVWEGKRRSSRIVQISEMSGVNYEDS